MDTGIALIQSSRVSQTCPAVLPHIRRRVEEVVFRERPKASLLQTFQFLTQFCSGCGIGAEMTYHLPHLKPYPIKPDKGHQRTKSIWSCHCWLNLRLNLLRLWLRWCCSLGAQFYISVCIHMEQVWMMAMKWFPCIKHKLLEYIIPPVLKELCQYWTHLLPAPSSVFQAHTRSAVQQPKISSESQQSVCRAWHVCVSLCMFMLFG